MRYNFEGYNVFTLKNKGFYNNAKKARKRCVKSRGAYLPVINK